MNWTSGCRNTRYGLLHAIGVLAVSAHTQGTNAQPSPETTAIRAHLLVTADEQCATAAALEKRVRERSQRIRFVDKAHGVPQLVIRIGAGAADGRVMQLSMQWPDGQLSQRRLTARSCASGLDALALLLAMTLDPGAGANTDSPPVVSTRDPDDTDGPQPGPRARRRSPAPEAVAPKQPPNASDADASPTKAPDAAPQPSGQGGPALGQRASQDRQPTATPASGARASNPLGVDHLVLTINAQLALGVAPRAMPGLGLHAVVALKGTGWWAPALGLQLVHSWMHGLEEPGGKADFELDSLELGACPLGLRLALFTARACLVGAFGRLTATGSDTYAPQTRTRLWASVGGAARLSAGLGRWLVIQAGLELSGPIFRYGFAFRPELFHRIPAVYFQGHLGAGVRFP